MIKMKLEDIKLLTNDQIEVLDDESLKSIFVEVDDFLDERWIQTYRYPKRYDKVKGLQQSLQGGDDQKT